MAERRTVTINVVSNVGGASRGIGNLNRQMGSLQKGTGKATKSVKGLGKTAQSAKRGLGSLAGGMSSAGLAAGAAGAAILVVGSIVKGAVSAFAEFDDAMNSSVAIMGEVSDMQRGEMSMAAREMAKVTRFSAKEAAESYFFLASAGLNVEQAIGALPVVARFAQAGMFDMALATDLATDAQSALGLTSDDTAANIAGMTRVTDVFVKANTLANTSVQQVSEAITNKLGGALRAYNITVEEGVAVLAAYADQGLKGASAGEAFNIMLRDLKKVGTDSADVLARNNIEIFDANGNFRAMADIIDDLTAAFDGLSVAEQTKLANDIGFQDRSFKNIQLLLGMGDAVRGYNEELELAAGTTQEISDKQMESFAAQMDIVKSRVTDLGIELGEQLAPVILEVADSMISMLEDVMPLLGALATLSKFIFEFSGMKNVVDAFAAVGLGFTRLSGIWDEGAAKSIIYIDAVKKLQDEIENGEDPTTNLANAMNFLLIKNELTTETMGQLASEVGITSEMMLAATASNFEWAEQTGQTAGEIEMLRRSLLAQVEASNMDLSVKDKLIAKYGLFDDEAARMISRFEGAADAADGLRDAEGNLIDETGDTVDVILTLAEALAEAEANQDSLASAMLEFASPMLAAAAATRDLQTAEDDLHELQDDHHSTLEELADQELKVLEARLKTQAAYDAFSTGNLQDQVDVVRDVLGKSQQEALDFLFALDLIDAADINASVTVSFFTRGSAAAAAAAAQMTGAGRQGSFTNAIRGLAHGGDLRRGESAIVGEEGPELFAARGAGTILTAGQTSNIVNNAGARSMSVTFINSQLANDPVTAMRRAFARDALQTAV